MVITAFVQSPYTVVIYGHGGNAKPVMFLYIPYVQRTESIGSMNCPSLSPILYIVASCSNQKLQPHLYCIPQSHRVNNNNIDAEQRGNSGAFTDRNTSKQRPYCGGKVQFLKVSFL